MPRRGSRRPYKGRLRACTEFFPSERLCCAIKIIGVFFKSSIVKNATWTHLEIYLRRHNDFITVKSKVFEVVTSDFLARSHLVDVCRVEVIEIRPPLMLKKITVGEPANSTLKNKCRARKLASWHFARINILNRYRKARRMLRANNLRREIRGQYFH